MESSSHSPEFIQKHNNRIKKELQKLAELPKEFNCQEIDHQHSKVFKVTIGNKILSQLKIEDINRGEEIEFQIILSEQYPFIMPQICCVTKLPFDPQINDRRNLIEDIMGCAWGPAVIIRGAIEKIPSFLKTLYENKDSKEYLHNLGLFIQTELYSRQDLNRSSLQIFDAIEITKNMLFMEQLTPTLLCLSGSFLLIFQVKQKSSLLILNKYYRLRNNLTILQKIDKIQVITQQYQTSQRSFKFQPAAKQKQFCLIYKHLKQCALLKDQLVGNVTKLNKKALEQRISDLQVQGTADQKWFEQLKNCLSDMIEICSVTSEQELPLYKQRLTDLFKIQQFQHIK